MAKKIKYKKCKECGAIYTPFNSLQQVCSPKCASILAEKKVWKKKKAELEFNVNGQCSRPCNKDKSGDINNYRINFVKRYSEEKLKELDEIAHIEKKYSLEEIQELIKIYKLKIKDYGKNSSRVVK